MGMIIGQEESSWLEVSNQLWYVTSAKLNKIKRDIAEQFGITSRSITHEIKPHVLK